jgi:YggT family protein
MICEVNPFLRLLCVAATVYSFVLLLWVIVSWIRFAGWRPPISGPLRGAVDLLEDLVRPVVTPLRRIVPPAGPLDLSVIVAFVILIVIQQAVC